MTPGSFRLAARKIGQFHEQQPVIDWWCRNLHWLLNWMTPGRRRALLAIAALYVAFRSSFDDLAAIAAPQVDGGVLLSVSVLLSTLGFAWFAHRISVRLKSMPRPQRQHPQISLHLLIWAIFCMAWLASDDFLPGRNYFAAMAFMLSTLAWRLGYMLFSSHSSRVSPGGFKDHLIYLFPAYGGTETPYGKGIDYMAKFEARTAMDLARSQLSGVKLILLSGILNVTLAFFEAAAYGTDNFFARLLGGHSLGIPERGEAAAQGVGTPTVLGWASVYCELIRQVLHLAYKGHRIIGILRISGFNVMRNTYKPLLAESVHDFWNRYYFYFKELLVTFFFMPIFMGSGVALRHWPRLRLFIAVLGAAAFGNIYYHFLKLHTTLVEGHVDHALAAMESPFFYSLLLALGIYISMRRRERRGAGKLSSDPLSRGLRIFGVWTFFSLIFIWDVRGGASFSARTSFFLSLFGFL